MDIRLFAFVLLIVSAGAYFIPVENHKKANSNKDIPMVVFEEPIMHTIDKDGVSRVVQASHALRYKNRDEMLNADIILKTDTKSGFELEKLKAKSITKKGDLFVLEKDVNYKRDDYVDFNTQELFYNMKTKVATNTVAFDGTYNDHKLNGTGLYLDANKSTMKTKKVHLEIDIKNK